jgi:ComF family protein
MDGAVRERGLHLLREFWRSTIDFVAPPRCLICHQPVAEPAGLCVLCWAGLKQIDDPVCNVMGTPFAYDQGEGSVSAAAVAEPPAWDRARAAVAYDEAARPIVHALKYRDIQEAGLLMARMMGRAGRTLLADADMIVPVPLHRWRLWWRRFNQSAYLAQHLAEAAGKSYRPDLLQRVGATRSQVGLDHEARRKNVRRAFRLPAEGAGEVAGRRVLLVDDVMTTGATAGACAEALKAAGAAKVDVLTFALVLEPKQFHIS